MVSGHQGDFPSLQFLGLHTVDLFATQLNNKVEAFFSHLPGPLALSRNPLQAERVYCTCVPHPPPPPLLSLALHKVILEGTQVITILLWWPQRGWFPVVLQLFVDLPVLVQSVMVFSPDGSVYPHLWVLSLAT